MPSAPRGLAVAAPSEVAADAAGQVARSGGNAVDAALAAALVAMVNEVGIVSLSSGGFVTVQPGRDDGGAAYCVDGWMDVPGRGLSSDAARAGRTWDIRTEYGGGVDVTIGPGSVATHGSVAAFGEVHARDGRLPWREVVAPAIGVARDGFRLGSATRYYLDYVLDDVFGWDDASRAALVGADGALTTDPVVVPGLAGSLEQIAADPRAMHRGALGDAISADVRARGGLLGAADLAAYEPVVRGALVSRTHGWAWATTPPPSVGGVVVTAILRLLDGWDPAAPGADTRLEAAQREVLGHRLDVLDHSTDLEADAAAYLAGVGTPHGSGSTAHVSAVDTDGLACAVTVSSGYGSGMIAGGTGIWLNNCLGEQELTPRGPHGTPAGSRLLSNMAPTVARHDDGRTLAIGSPGADRITTAITQTLARYVAGAGLQDAVDHPRVHVHRPGRPDEAVRREVVPTMYFGGVGAALVRADGRLVAAADPRREGAVRIVGGFDVR